MIRNSFSLRRTTCSNVLRIILRANSPSGVESSFSDLKWRVRVPALKPWMNLVTLASVIAPLSRYLTYFYESNKTTLS